MAEPIKKTYISAREFVDSWEKEIYELSNLDYFIYLLINELASGIEKQYFGRLKHSHPLFLESDEIGSLSFSLSDSIQNFLENNCFLGCSLNCPLKLEQPVNRDNMSFRFLPGEDEGPKPEFIKVHEDLLYFDLVNYVVPDALIDFYSFEMEKEIKLTDKALLELTDLLMNIIMDFFRKNGQNYLTDLRESSGYLFDQLLRMDAPVWKEETDGGDDEMDNEEGEEWKITPSSPEYVFNNFRETGRFDNEANLNVFNKFETFIRDFLNIGRSEELSQEDIEEFFGIVAVNEMILEEGSDFDGLVRIFNKFLAYLEFNYDLLLLDGFKQFCAKKIPELERTFLIARSYKMKNPMIQYMLSDEKKDNTLTDGFFEISNCRDNFFSLRDIHFKTTYENVDLTGLDFDSLKKGDILHAQLINRAGGWRLIHLEMIYPAYSKGYLF